MMTKEEVASIVKYRNVNGVSYKVRLSELGVPEWKLFESKRRYAKEQAFSASTANEFLQLTAGGDLVPMSSFAAKTGRGFSKKVSVHFSALPFEKLDSPLPKSNFKANGNEESNSTGIRPVGRS